VGRRPGDKFCLSLRTPALAFRGEKVRPGMTTKQKNPEFFSQTKLRGGRRISNEKSFGF